MFTTHRAWFNLRILANQKCHAATQNAKPSAPAAVTEDAVGPTDPRSNLNLVRFYVPPDETPAEKEFRLKRIEAQAFNHQFWTEHNSNFNKEKKEFMEEVVAAKERPPTAEEMSEFYRKSLDKDRQKHLDYNKEWQKRNFKMLFLSVKALISRRRRKLP